MAIVGHDGFDAYTAAQAIREGWDANFSSNATGRFGTGQCIRLTGAAIPTRAMPATSTCTMGFAFRTTTALAARICAVMRDSGVQVELRYAADGSLNITRNGTLIVGASSAPGIFVQNVWHYIVWAMTIHGTTGTFGVWVDGVSVMSGSGENTRTTANNSVNAIGFSDVSSVTHEWDDLWYSNDLTNRGDMRSVALLPNGAGNSTQFTPSAGSNFQNVDETTANDDIDYNASSTPGHIDLYAMDDLPTAASSIAAVTARIVARKDDAGARDGRTVIRTVGTNYEGPTVALNATYVAHRTLYLTNPNTGTAWTESQVNAVEAGAKVQT